MGIYTIVRMTAALATAATPPAGLTGTVTDGRGGLRDAVVWVDAGRRSEPMHHAVVDQRNKTFIPHVEVITVGTTVEFPNHDSVFHNVFAYFKAARMDLGNYPRGATKSWKFDKPGLVVLMCNMHSDMCAYLVVVDTPFYAKTDSAGRFRIPDLPPGTYKLHVWQEHAGTAEMEARAGGAEAPVTVSMRRK